MESKQRLLLMTKAMMGILPAMIFCGSTGVLYVVTIHRINPPAEATVKMIVPYLLTVILFMNARSLLHNGQVDRRRESRHLQSRRYSPSGPTPG